MLRAERLAQRGERLGGVRRRRQRQRRQRPRVDLRAPSHRVAPVVGDRPARLRGDAVLVHHHHRELAVGRLRGGASRVEPRAQRDPPVGIALHVLAVEEHQRQSGPEAAVLRQPPGLQAPGVQRVRAGRGRRRRRGRDRGRPTGGPAVGAGAGTNPGTEPGASPAEGAAGFAAASAAAAASGSAGGRERFRATSTRDASSSSPPERHSMGGRASVRSASRTAGCRSGRPSSATRPSGGVRSSGATGTSSAPAAEAIAAPDDRVDAGEMRARPSLLHHRYVKLSHIFTTDFLSTPPPVDPNVVPHRT